MIPEYHSTYHLESHSKTVRFIAAVSIDLAVVIPFPIVQSQQVKTADSKGSKAQLHKPKPFT